MENQHSHPGQNEPRSYQQTHHENRTLDLNTASVEEIADLPMVGRERASALVEARPFRTWDEVSRVPGFSGGMLDDLKSGGAQLGATAEKARERE